MYRVVKEFQSVIQREYAICISITSHIQITNHLNLYHEDLFNQPLNKVKFNHHNQKKIIVCSLFVMLKGVKFQQSLPLTVNSYQYGLFLICSGVKCRQ